MREGAVRDAFLGLAIGDALGVPYELGARDVLEADPVTDMVGHLAHDKPPGTWSDDGSLTFCVADSLIEGFDVERMGKSFLAWFDEGHWSADGKAFGSGGTTRAALKKIREGGPCENAGMTTMESNGNGSLMRTLPLAFYLRDRDTYEKWAIIRSASSITHAHPIACMCCHYYVDFAILLLRGATKETVYSSLKEHLRLAFNVLSIENGFEKEDLRAFDRLLVGNIHTLPSSEIRSGSYVVDSLEAAIWCLMTSRSYKETVLKAVNLGGDSDSTAAIAGGLAGILYGLDDVPKHWLNWLARKEDIERLADEFEHSVNKEVIEENA